MHKAISLKIVPYCVLRGCPFLILHTRSEEIFEEYQNVSHPAQRLYKCFATRPKKIRPPFPDLLSINNRSIMYGIEPRQMFRTPGKRSGDVSYPQQISSNQPGMQY
jgi:hypothetical protein